MAYRPFLVALDRIASPEMFPEAEMLPHLICSRPILIGGANDEADLAKAKPKRSRRRPDPFAAVTAELRGWFEAEPWHTSRELLERLQAQCPGVYPDGQLRTLQRRLKDWRREAAHREWYSEP